MKEKVIVVLLIVLITIYLVFAVYWGHQKWEDGISVEEQIREEMLIW